MHLPSKPNQRSASERAQAKLQQIWGYSTFRPPQQAIVECLLRQQDALIVLPTGGGKSVCYQLPALMQPGLTVVISPLVALMENQVQELRDRQLPAALLHSELSKAVYRQTLGSLDHHKLRLLYVSPETLLSRAIWERLCQPTLPICSLIVDEAHCLEQWGETFRPAYYRLGSVRRSLLQHKPPGTQIAIAAFTATANPHTQQCIQQLLYLNNPAIFQVSPYRSNLHLSVKIAWTPRQRRQLLLQCIHQHPQQAGLVYVRTRRASEELAEWLNQQGFQTAAYHAGLAPAERRQIEQAWLNHTFPFVVCTNAFGMGLNKSCVRWIVHFHAPTMLAEYVQEVGRAGRDGEPATALLLRSEPSGWLDPDDKQRWQFFENQMQKQYRLAEALVRKLPKQGEVATISRQFSQGAIALSLLHSAGCLEWLDPFHYNLHQPHLPPHLGQSNRQAAQQMRQYLQTRQCRWQFLLAAFGCDREAHNFRCGHCDNCR